MTQDRQVQAKGPAGKIPVKSKDSDRVLWVTPETLKKQPGKYQQVKQPKAPPPAGKQAPPNTAPAGKGKKQPPPVPEAAKKKPAPKPEALHPEAPKPGHDEHGEHGEHGDKPKKSWKETFQGLGKAAQQFLKTAPKSVKAFVTDPAVRKQALSEAKAGVKSLPKKAAQGLLETAKHEVHEFKLATAGVKSVMAGKKMSKHQKQAFRTVATHLAIGVAAAALTASGPLSGAGLFAKGMARHIAAKSVHRSLEKAHLLDELGHIGHAVQHLLTASEDGLTPKVQPTSSGPDEAERAMMKLIMYCVSKEMDELSEEDISQILNSMSEDSAAPEGDGNLEESSEPESEPETDETATQAVAPEGDAIVKEARVVLARFLKSQS